MKFLHAADLHIDSPMIGLDAYEGAPREALRGATRAALRRLVQLALDEGVDFVLLAGDIYDGEWRDHSTGLFFIREMGRLAEANIQVYCLYGNHDAESQLGKKFQLPANVHAFDHQAAHTHIDRALGIAVHGQSFADRAVSVDLAAGYPARQPGLFNIGLLHTALEGREGHGAYAPTTLDVLRGKGYDYWALGHIHKREVVCEDPWVIFPGNLQGRSVRETGPKGATLVSVDSNQRCSPEHRTLDLVRWDLVRVDASACESAAEVLELLCAELQSAVERAEQRLLAVRVEVHGTTLAHGELNSDPEHWISEVRALGLQLAPDGIFVERVKTLTRAPLDLAALRERDDPTGLVARRLQSLREDDAALAQLRAGLDEDLAALLKKLPAEAQEDEQGRALTEPAALREALDDAEQLLLARLIQRETP